MVNMSNDDPYGYLLVHFIEDPTSYAERIYMDLSVGDNPNSWRPLNGGVPVLTSHVGTTGSRDPYVVRNPETGCIYLLATDLRVFGKEGGSDRIEDWYARSHQGSTNLLVWQTDDLVHWSDVRLLDVSDRGDGSHAQLGMAWAPEATWVPDYYPQGHSGGSGAFVLYWSSKLFADDDSGHEDPTVHDRVLWGVTTDFTQETFSLGGVFIDRGHDTIDTTMLQLESPSGAKRTYRVTKDNGPDPNIWLDATDDPHWWLPQTRWTVLQERIGANWIEDNNPAGVEGPALFASHSDPNVYLYVDVIPSIGYRPMVGSDPDRGFEYMALDDFHMRAHTKHGGVLSLTRAEYERLRSSDGIIGTGTRR
ncbi:hypothetical protein GA0061078_1241 [Bifidobacterium bohemicum]|uniref:Endo-1,4-beta-xylanase n=2 Tax=Bifidobacterium bohemicum TaxID=638617 RepID=A0A086ZHI7_9BIFI|nr:endo-1,4-beta-xylanase [Bifidobacterium bohemicum DSM 22767]SCC03965.1 hypothetical protein GA0061078_1241 [Bifidobacterium bohemicum]